MVAFCVRSGEACNWLKAVLLRRREAPSSGSRPLIGCRAGRVNCPCRRSCAFSRCWCLRWKRSALTSKRLNFNIPKRWFWLLTFSAGAWQTRARSWNSCSMELWWGCCLCPIQSWSESTKPTMARPAGSGPTCGALSTYGEYRIFYTHKLSLKYMHVSGFDN